MSVNQEQATTLIVERAKQLVSQLIENRGHDKPPFLPEEFARLRGINKIVKADLGKTSAVLLRFPDSYVIKVNEKHHPVRQNFSCAHEIGHILFSELKLERYIPSIEYRTFNPQAQAIDRAKTRERLCDVAAAELLMPEMVFRKYLSGVGVSIDVIERLADIFRASVQATAIRIAEVSPEPCLALLWKPILGTKSKLLKLAWCVGSGIKLPGRSYYMPVHTNIKYNIKYPSTLHKAYEDNKSVKCHRDFKHGTDVKRLLMESKGFGHGEARYVISLAFLDR